VKLIHLPETADTAATNMAIDASLLHSVPEESAIFRHYGWSEPVITFGYTQRFEDVKTIVPNDIHLCRRITGGGIVDHRNDWTYALILHTTLKLAHIPANELYAIIHRSIQQALITQAIETQLAPCPRVCGEPPVKPSAKEPSQCFLLPAANDVIHPDGQKIAGAAMKRTRQGLLVQGSIDRSALPDTFDFKDLSNSLTETLASMLSLTLTKNFENLINVSDVHQERKRFESAPWTHRR